MHIVHPRSCDGAFLRSSRAAVRRFVLCYFERTMGLSTHETGLESIVPIANGFIDSPLLPQLLRLSFRGGAARFSRRHLGIARKSGDLAATRNLGAGTADISQRTFNEVIDKAISNVRFECVVREAQ